MRYEIQRTKVFDNWLASLRNRQAVKAINKRLARLELGNFGDHKQLAGNLFELRFFLGSGYRVYYTIRGRRVVFLLAGGDKSSQKKDIQQAKAILSVMEGIQ